MTQVFMIGDLSRLHNLPAWKVRSAVNRFFEGTPSRLSNTSRVFTADDLPKVAKALQMAGYLATQEAGTR